MATGLLSRLRTVTQQAFGLTAEAPAPALLSLLTSPPTDLVRADANWQPDPLRLRIEIMASGPFENLHGIRTVVHRLQGSLVGASRQERSAPCVLELRLTEVRRNCRHVTAWRRSPVDPGAGTTEWECLEEALGDDPENRTRFAQAFRDSVRNGVNHIVLFGDSCDDGSLVLNAAVCAFRRYGIRVSTFYLGNDFIARHRYRFLAAATGGLHLSLPAGDNHERSLEGAVLPIVAAFACGDHARLAALPAPTPEAQALMKQVGKR
jgi:hypothetical protein